MALVVVQSLYLQFQDKDDMLSVLVDLVQVDDVDVFHLGQDVDLLLDVFPGDAASGSLQPLLLDELGGVLGSRRLLDHPVHVGELAPETEKLKLIQCACKFLKCNPLSPIKTLYICSLHRWRY